VEGEEGRTIEDDQGIREEFYRYFLSLFSSENRGNFLCRYLETRIVNKLSIEDRDSMDKDIDIREIEEVVRKLARGKSLGLDGIPNEFYQKLWAVMETNLVNLVQTIFNKGKMSKGLNKSLIALMSKISGPRKVKDFRPISLLGGVYKIITKIMANRIRLLVPKLVHPYQSGFVHGRSLAETCLSIWSGVEEGPKVGEFVLLKEDFEKAYDRVEWRFLEMCLRIMNFGSKFCSWVRGILGNVSAVVLVNGDLIEDLPITRSVRQGCPLALVLFALVTEPLVRGFLQK